MIIRRWSADKNYNGNTIFDAFKLYLPGVDLTDNPKLNDKIQNIEQEETIGFFEAQNFEKELQEFFKQLTENTYSGEK